MRIYNLDNGIVYEIKKAIESNNKEVVPVYLEQLRIITLLNSSNLSDTALEKMLIESSIDKKSFLINPIRNPMGDLEIKIISAAKVILPLPLQKIEDLTLPKPKYRAGSKRSRIKMKGICSPSQPILFPAPYSFASTNFNFLPNESVDGQLLKLNDLVSNFVKQSNNPKSIDSGLLLKLMSFLPSKAEVKSSQNAEPIQLMEKKISDTVIKNMEQYFNKHDMGSGIWYPNDYSEYLMKEHDIKMPESFLSGFANEEYFEKTGRFTFKLKEGQKASEALLSFLKGPTVADCENAIMACFYKTVLDIIGEEKFNEIYGSNSLLPLLITLHGITDQNSPISQIADYTPEAKQGLEGVHGKRPLKLGEECHFKGVIYYGNKHPEGFGGGWNVIYIGDDIYGNQLFTAHGFEKPLTEKQIYSKLLELYNQERTIQDEEFIKKANNPRWYDRETNQFLKTNYTISPKALEENFEKYMTGFLVYSQKNLVPEKLVELTSASLTSVD